MYVFVYIQIHVFLHTKFILHKILLLLHYISKIHVCNFILHTDTNSYIISVCKV